MEAESESARLLSRSEFDLESESNRSSFFKNSSFAKAAIARSLYSSSSSLLLLSSSSSLEYSYSKSFDIAIRELGLLKKLFC